MSTRFPSLTPIARTVNKFLWIFHNIIVYTKVIDAKFPGREGIRAHSLAISSFDCRLVRQLGIDRIEYQGPLASCEHAQMLTRIW